jgi:thiamine biosynthesis lipoprotein
MGTTAHIKVLGPASALEHARRRLADLESKWSRFRPDSEVSALNRALGRPHDVSVDTIRLITSALRAAAATRGRFDPTVHDALCRLGYDRSFRLLDPPADTDEPEPSPGGDAIDVDPDACSVRFPLGVRFDPGGIGKGLAADMVAEELVSASADGALVNLGGDVRVAGAGPEDGWRIRLDEPTSDGAAVTVRLSHGALATSTTLRRRWRIGATEVHHLIDPATGGSASTRWTVATAIAGTAWWAEAATKPLLLDGPAGLPPLAAGRLTDQDGRAVLVGGFEEYL